MKALTVGSAMIDTIAIIDSDRIELMTMMNADKTFLLMEEGKKTEAAAISTHLGGGGVNTAVCLARLGLETSTLIKIGSDPRGDDIVVGLAREGVSTDWVRRTEAAPTGASVIVASHSRNAGIFTYRGANTLLEDADIDDVDFEAGLVHVCSLSHPSTACFPRIVKAARAKGAQVSANPGPRQLAARAGELLDTLRDLDILFLNRGEAETLMPQLVPQFGEGGPRLAARKSEAPELLQRGLSGGGFEMSLARFAAALLKLGVRTLVVTDGGRGAYIAADGRLTYCPVMRSKVAGTAGAGDSFAATFAGWAALGASLEEAVIAAAHNAAEVVAHVDTQTGLMSRSDLVAQVENSRLREEVRSWTL